MRCLHLSDWHLGRTTRGVSRAPDHDHAIEQMVGIARDERPDVILHAGDLFDTARPGYDDMRRAVDALRRLAETAPVVVIAGNHDSSALLDVYARLGEGAVRVRFVADPRGETLSFPCAGGGAAVVGALPWVHPHRALQAGDPSTWGDAYARHAGGLLRDLGGRMAALVRPGRDVGVVTAHLTLRGARPARSERPLHVSGAYAVPADAIGPCAYAAIGHVHRPQETVGGPPGRYAGSPLPLDFGEEGMDASVVVVEARPGGPATVRTVALDPGRPLLTLRGDLEHLARSAHRARGALCRVTALTPAPRTDLADAVARVLPGAVLVEISEECSARAPLAPATGGAGPGSEPSLTDLMRGYLAERGTPDAREVLGAFAALLGAAESETSPYLPALERLESGGGERAEAA
jgi:exonuclease SbcD